MLTSLLLSLISLYIYIYIYNPFPQLDCISFHRNYHYEFSLFCVGLSNCCQYMFPTVSNICCWNLSCLRHHCNNIGGTVVKNPPVNTGDAGVLGLIPGSGRSPGGENGNPLQYSCLDNPMDRGAWWATVCSVAKNWTQLSDQVYTLHRTP